MTKKDEITVTINMNNLNNGEREQLISLIDKGSKPKSKAWKPNKDEAFYYVDCCGDVAPAIPSSNRGFFISTWRIGNCFRTDKEARNVVERLKIRAELKEYADEHNEPIEWEDDATLKWSIAYSYRHTDIVINAYSDLQEPFQIYFSSEEIARKAIESVGEDRIKKYLFGVK